MKRLIGIVALCVLAGLLPTGVRAQGFDAMPEGCCWLQGWEQAGFEGADTVLNGPGEWRNWDDRFGSVRVGECANVSVWTEADFEGRRVDLVRGERRTDFDSESFPSMKMVCDDEEDGERDR